MGDQIDQLPQFVHFSWCITKLGEAFTVPVEMVDDLYTAIVSGPQEGKESSDELNAFGGPYPTEEEKFSDLAYLKFFHALVGIGVSVFPFEQWIKDNPESEAWADFVSDGSDVVIQYEEDRDKWISQFKEKMALNKNS